MPFLTRLYSLFKFLLARVSVRGMGVTASALGLLLALVVGLSLLDNRTHVLSIQMGKLLAATNPLRPRVGSLWQRIEAQVRSRETITEKEVLNLDDLKSGLPTPIRENRFECEIIPDQGIPGYISIWKTPLPNTPIETRPLSDLIRSRRIYDRGLSVVEALTLPEALFHNQVSNQVDLLYKQFEEVGTTGIDTLMTIEGDTLEALAPDSLRASLFTAIAAEMVPLLRNNRRTALIQTYREGGVIQILLYRDLGCYRGEIYRDAAHDMPLPFAISLADAARIFQFPDPGSELSDSPETDHAVPAP
jgi:hypothetical protein